MKTLLMIAPFFPPRKRVGALRPYRFARHLEEFGWTPRIISLSSSEDKSAELREFLEGIDHFTIGLPWDRTENPKNRSPQVFGEHPAKPPKGSKTLLDRVSDRIDRNIPLDSWLPLFRLRYSSILEFVKSGPVDSIWSTGDPWSSHWLGWKLASNLKKPWLADFRDPWTLSSVRLRQRSRLANGVDRHYERRFLAEASRVTFTAQGTLQRYVETYPELQGRAHLIYNSGLEPLESSDVDAGRSVSVGSSEAHFGLDLRQLAGIPDPIILLFFGSFRRLSPLKPILDVFKEVRALELKGAGGVGMKGPTGVGLKGVGAKPAATVSPGLLERIRIFHYGALLKDDAETVEREGFSNQFIAMPYVREEYSRNLFEQADLLLLSTHPQRTEIIPAKLWDYFGSLKPILSLCPNPEVGQLLTETDCGVQFNPNESERAAEWLIDWMSKQIDQVGTFDKPGIVSQSTLEKQMALQNRFSPRAMTKAWVDILETLQ